MMKSLLQYSTSLSYLELWVNILLLRDSINSVTTLLATELAAQLFLNKIYVLHILYMFLKSYILNKDI